MSIEPTDASTSSRREALANLLMASGLFAGYGVFASYAIRYLFPARPDPEGWAFVAPIARVAVGQSFLMKTPAGQPITITRRGDRGDVDDFLALSSVCPHLGCSVHWEPQHDRFFCPCHNGAFAPDGRAVDGPPAQAGQSLTAFPLQVENGLLFVRVPLDALG